MNAGQAATADQVLQSLEAGVDSWRSQVFGARSREQVSGLDFQQAYSPAMSPAPRASATLGGTYDYDLARAGRGPYIGLGLVVACLLGLVAWSQARRQLAARTSWPAAQRSAPVLPPAIPQPAPPAPSVTAKDVLAFPTIAPKSSSRAVTPSTAATVSAPAMEGKGITAPPADNVPRRQTVTISGTVNVRAEAQRSSRIVRKLPNGSQVAIVGTEGEWSKVALNGSTLGYVKSDAMKAPAQAKPPLLLDGCAKNIQAAKVAYDRTRTTVRNQIVQDHATIGRLSDVTACTVYSQTRSVASRLLEAINKCPAVPLPTGVSKAALEQQIKQINASLQNDCR